MKKCYVILQKPKITYLLTIIMKQVYKVLATLLLIVACAASASAADFLTKPLDVQRMEGDANFGFSFPADSYHDMHARVGLNMDPTQASTAALPQILQES